MGAVPTCVELREPTKLAMAFTSFGPYLASRVRHCDRKNQSDWGVPLQGLEETFVFIAVPVSTLRL